MKLQQECTSQELVRVQALLARGNQLAANLLRSKIHRDSMPNMRGALLLVALTMASGFNGCSYMRPRAAAAAGAIPTVVEARARTKIDFTTQIRPILEARCHPCHFSGGKVYATLPFDRPETIKKLGEKLFTRIKDEREQRLIREFLAQE